jgi:hypothetical protein
MNKVVPPSFETTDVLGVDIYYPNASLLYFPLLLAYDMGFFPENTTLHLVATDRDAVDEIRRADKSNNRIQIAVCDPVAGDIGRRHVDGSSERICVVGTMITGIPLWLSNSTFGDTV